MTFTREQLTEQIIQAGQFLYARGWSPATSSNYSARLSNNQVLLTVSGKHKGQLTEDDILATDLQGKSLEPHKKPSAEALLHTQLYNWSGSIQAVLHTHSVNATVLSRLETTAQIEFTDYELQKAFNGISSHEQPLLVPIFDNDQDMPRLAQHVQQWLDSHPDCPGYLIRGHGLYTWGASMQDALRHIEAFEFLLECELKVRACLAY
ncbi:MAG: methylthioribulose 1-phosphate dehydratase [Pseudomonas sp.]|jgi:methylthioribulose-1-phosphate dehydratase|nr:methylthioribulose 1-phosphate dehydratase [Pseudomonas sp.]MDD2222628.1 methylthioribulose 1-phosphate dehydratase [Pseudomonas sp.]MDY0413728.1 methylthioribulose 1-phosphate dehydratase [Pseudomonas sp.]NLO53385.1 methylthioribulose 1-phosphate dehydratase [Gammaproteobacteria bacterium]